MLPNIKKLLKILSDGEYHSDATIAKKLGIAQATIWELIQQLKTWNIEVEAKPNQGYRIPGGMDLLDSKKIKTQLPLQIFDALTSTNTFLLDRIREGKKDIQICLAEYQEAGRGRFGKHWISAYGKNIYFSLLWTFQGDLSQLAGLSLAIAVAVVRALKAYGIQEALGLKWPNDIQWRGKKLAGILVELNAQSNCAADIVIGIGINGSLSPALRKLVPQNLADIEEITGQRFERNLFVNLLIHEIQTGLMIFQEKGLAAFIPEWQALAVMLDQKVNLLLGEKKLTGIYRGVDPASGELLLEDQGGKIHRYAGGEVSLRLANEKMNG